MEQTELREQLDEILHKHWCKSTNAKDDYYENALNAMEEAYSLNRSVPTAIDIKELKDLFSSVHQLIAGWNATEAQWSEWDKEVYDKLMDFWKRIDKLHITLSLPESKQLTVEKIEEIMANVPLNKETYFKDVAQQIHSEITSLPESKNVPSEERQKVIKEIMEKHRQDNLYSSKPPFILFDELAAKIDLAFIH